MNKHEAIFATHLNVVTIRGEEAFDVNENSVQYDETAVQAYINANAYKAKRAAEYPPITDQLDLLYHGGMDAWKTAIQAVKDKYPKG
jgi:rhodanese-related sulfurtransferase